MKMRKKEIRGKRDEQSRLQWWIKAREEDKQREICKLCEDNVKRMAGQRGCNAKEGSGEGNTS